MDATGKFMRGLLATVIGLSAYPAVLRADTNNATGSETKAPVTVRTNFHAAPPNVPPPPLLPESFQAVRKMTPEQRQAETQRLREIHAAGATNSSPALKATLQQHHDAIERRLAELRLKKADGTITPAEQAQLDHWETALRQHNPMLREGRPIHKDPPAAAAPATNHTSDPNPH